MNHNFPKGRVTIVYGSRGRKSDVRYKMKLYDAETNESGSVVTAVLGYRGRYWRMDKWGKIYRVSCGKMVTLCDDALVTTNIHPE